MALDVPTLMFAGAFVSVLCGAFLLSVWWQHREAAALWWMACFLALGGAIASLAVGVTTRNDIAFLTGLALLIMSPTFAWAGLRRFFDRPFRRVYLGAPVALWTLAAVSTQLVGNDWAAQVIHSLVIVALNAAIIRELLLDNGEELRARGLLALLSILNIITYLLAIPEALNGQLSGEELPALGSMFGLVHFETLIYAIGATVFLVALMKERSEQRHMRDAQTDALTGLANRRAFLPMAERAAERCRRKGQPYAVVVFDLDHFKLVNDSYGHAAGDEVLRIFARVARDGLRPGDIVSRVGGEEFYAILPFASAVDGCATADRVRAAFESADIVIGGQFIAATVSAGVMACSDGTAALDALLERADAALYRAKLNGRNRVECGIDEAKETRPYPRLVRVA